MPWEFGKFWYLSQPTAFKNSLLWHHEGFITNLVLRSHSFNSKDPSYSLPVSVKITALETNELITYEIIGDSHKHAFIIIRTKEINLSYCTCFIRIYDNNWLKCICFSKCTRDNQEDVLTSCIFPRHAHKWTFIPMAISISAAGRWCDAIDLTETLLMDLSIVQQVH